MKLNHTEYRSFLLGNVLGDGKIHNGSFSVAQVSKDLIEFKERIFKRYCNSDVKTTYKEGYVDRFGVKRQDTYYIYVKPNEYFKKIYKQYMINKNDGRVENTINITIETLNKLTPLGIAIWFADDGTTVLVGAKKKECKSRRVMFCTDRYSYAEIVIMKQFFDKRYGNCSIIKRKDRYRIQLSLEAVNNMFDEILPYFYKYFPSMLYKFDLGYREPYSKNGFSKKNLEIRDYYIHNIYNIIKTHADFIDRLA